MSTLVRFRGENDRQKGLFIGRLGLVQLLLAGFLGIIEVLLEGHAGVVLLAHMWRDGAGNPRVDLAIFFFMLFLVKARVAPTEREGRRIRH